MTIGTLKQKKIIYTGQIDAYFNYCLGYLDYRSLRFETEVLDISNFQGNAVVNYTDFEAPWTRIIEHKWFEFGKTTEKTIISREYSVDWEPRNEPYYPVNDDKNSYLFSKYKELARNKLNTVFVGRLGEYKYYDMAQVIEAALKTSKEELAI